VCIASLLITTYNVFVIGLLLGLFIFILFVKKPELALAVQFSGTILYFYLLYKLGLAPFRELTGGFHVFLIISYLFGGIILLLKNQRNFKLGSIDVLFILLFFWLFMSYFIFSMDNEAAYQKVMFAPFLVIAPYFGIQLLSSEERIKKFYDYSVLFPALLIIPAFYEFLFNPTLKNMRRFIPYNFKQEVQDPHVFAIGYCVLILILVVTTLDRKEKISFKHIILNILLIIPSIFFVISAGSRSRFFNLIITIAFYFILISKARIKRRIYILIIVVLASIIAYNYVSESTLSFIASTYEAKDIQGTSVYGRTERYKMALNDFLEHPIIGVGIGNSEKGVGFPHNILLEVAAELGIVGLLIFISMCLVSVWKALVFIRGYGSHESKLLMKLSLAFFIYSFLVLMYSERITTTIWFFLPMGIISYLSKNRMIRE
jgi:O-antigen ligase